jgi:hypothetical protein
MAIADDLTLSQASLQDYVECPYRFRLRYLDRVEWPAVEAEPAGRNERLRRDGAEFHRMVHQYLLGVPAERLRALAEHRSEVVDDGHGLAGWWRSFCEHRPADLPGERYPEVTLAAEMAGRRLAAKYDLVVVQEGGGAMILDWKTAGRRPREETVEGRLQTRVYPYLLALAGGALNGGAPFAPERIEMRYWYAAFPNEPTVIPYGRDRFEADGAYLTGLLQEISDRPADGFERTDDPGRCRLCTYRSLCGTAEVAAQGDLDEDEAVDFSVSIDDGDEAMGFDFAGVGEVSF